MLFHLDYFLYHMHLCPLRFQKSTQLQSPNSQPTPSDACVRAFCRVSSTCAKDACFQTRCSCHHFPVTPKTLNLSSKTLNLSSKPRPLAYILNHGYLHIHLRARCTTPRTTTHVYVYVCMHVCRGFCVCVCGWCCREKLTASMTSLSACVYLCLYVSLCAYRGVEKLAASMTAAAASRATVRSASVSRFLLPYHMSLLPKK